jgi:hypothetical protein
MEVGFIRGGGGGLVDYRRDGGVVGGASTPQAG